MNPLSEQRCRNHAGREAVARCPGCRQYYCRECITEHEDRMLCAACLRRSTAAGGMRRGGLGRMLVVLQCAGSLLLAWLFFYGLGRVLLELPDAVHEGTVWQDPTAGEP
jgi:hypothetical protein